MPDATDIAARTRAFVAAGYSPTEAATYAAGNYQVPPTLLQMSPADREATRKAIGDEAFIKRHTAELAINKTKLRSR